MRSPHPPALSAAAVPASQGLPSGLSIGSIALLILGVQPILLGTLVEQKLITLSGVGIVAMGEIVALGLGVALGDALLPHHWQRWWRHCWIWPPPRRSAIPHSCWYAPLPAWRKGCCYGWRP